MNSTSSTLFSSKVFQISLVSNIVLIFFLIFFLFRSPSSILVLEHIDSIGRQKKELLPLMESQATLYFQMSDRELIQTLFSPPKPLFFGLKSTDIAVSLLYSRGYTLEIPLKSIKRWPQSKIDISFESEIGKRESLSCFSSIRPCDIAAIQKYLQVEKSPYTIEKMFALIKKEPNLNVTELLYRSKEWHQLQELFGSICGTNEKLLRYLLLFSWRGIEEHIAIAKQYEQEESLKTEQEKIVRKAVLYIIMHDFMRTHSPQLASCIVMTLNPLLFQTAPIEFYEALFQQIPPNFSDSATLFALHLLQNPIQDQLFYITQKYLTYQWKIPQGEKMDRKEFLVVLQNYSTSRRGGEALGKNRGLSTVQQNPERKGNKEAHPCKELQKEGSSALPYKVYVVQKGDTLWSIANKFQIRVDKIRYLNRIQGTSLTPGLRLRIPNRA